MNHGIGISTFFGARVISVISNHPLVKLSLAVIKIQNNSVVR